MNILHLPEASEFVYFEDNQKIFVSYRKKANHVEFLSTYVPFSLRGKGYAEQIVREALNWVKENEFTVTTRCWYVGKYLAENTDSG